MKRKTRSVLVIVIIALISVFALSFFVTRKPPESDNNDGNHIHKYTENVLVAPTLFEAGTSEYKCSCGDKYTTTTNPLVQTTTAFSQKTLDGIKNGYSTSYICTSNANRSADMFFCADYTINGTITSATAARRYGFYLGEKDNCIAIVARQMKDSTALTAVRWVPSDGDYGKVGTGDYGLKKFTTVPGEKTVSNSFRLFVLRENDVLYLRYGEKNCSLEQSKVFGTLRLSDVSTAFGSDNFGLFSNTGMSGSCNVTNIVSTQRDILSASTWAKLIAVFK